MTFSINAQGTKDSIEGELRTRVNALGTSPNTAGITDEEAQLLDKVVPKIVDNIVKDYPAESLVGVYTYGTADNMHTNVSVQVNATRTRPPQLDVK